MKWLDDTLPFLKIDNSSTSTFNVTLDSFNVTLDLFYVTLDSFTVTLDSFTVTLDSFTVTLDSFTVTLGQSKKNLLISQPIELKFMTFLCIWQPLQNFVLKSYRKKTFVPIFG